MIWALLIAAFTNTAHGLEKFDYSIDNLSSCGLYLGGSYRGGVNEKQSSKNCFQEVSNVYFTRDPGIIVSRESHNRVKQTIVGQAQSVDNIFNIRRSTSGQDFLMVKSSHVMTGCDLPSFNCPQSSFSSYNSTVNMRGVVALGSLWTTGGGTRTLRYDDTFSPVPIATVVTGSPDGTTMGFFRNRILISGVSGNRSSVYLSGELDGLDWTLGSRSTSPAILRIGGVDDFNEVICLMGQVQDVYLIGKAESLWGIYGFDQDDFKVRLIQSGVGCVSDRTVVIGADGSVRWLGKDGFYEMSGNNVRLISFRIGELGRSIGDLAYRSIRGTLGRRNFVAAEYRGNYFVSYTTDTATTTSFLDNDMGLVYEGNEVWTIIPQLRAASFARAIVDFGTTQSPEDTREALLYGESSVGIAGQTGSSGGNVYAIGCYGGDTCVNREFDLEETTQNFDAFVKTVNLDMGMPDRIKIFEQVYVDFYPQPFEFKGAFGTFSMPVSYIIDGSSDTAVEVTVATITVSGINRLRSAKINLGSTGVASAPKGKWISLKFLVNQANNPFNLKGIRIHGSVMSPI